MFNIPLVFRPVRWRLLGFIGLWISIVYLTNSAVQAQSLPSEPLRIVDVSEREYAGGAAITLTLSHALNNTETLDHYIDVTRRSEGRVLAQWALSESHPLAYLVNTEPSAHYTLTIKSGLMAKTGERLEQSETIHINTRAITPSVSFKTQGTVIQAGSDVGLPLAVMNVDEVDIDFHRVKPKQYLPFLQTLGKPKRTYGYQLQNASQYTEFLFSDRYALAVEKNRLQMRTIPIQERQELQAPGLYLAVIRQPGSYSNYYHLNYFTVTDIGIHLRNEVDGLSVYTQHLGNGDPMAGVTVQLLDQKGNTRQEGTSDEDGTVRLSSPGYPNINDGSRLLIATQGNSTTLLNLQQASLDLSEFALADRPARPQELFIYGDRDLYRPGDTLRLSALFRNHDGSPTQPIPLTAEIVDVTGKTLKTLRLAEQAYGYYAFEYALPRNAATGQWRVAVKGGSLQPYEHRFHVEAFLPERLQLTFDPPRSAPIRRLSTDDDITLTAQADYLYGAPAAGNRFEAQAKIRFEARPFKDHASYRDYHFGNVSQANSLKQTLPIPVHAVGDDGRVPLVIPKHLLPKPSLGASPLSLRIQASVYESGGRPVTRTHTSTLWPSTTLIGIRSNQGDNPEANALASFSVINLDKQAQLHAQSGLTAQLIREETQYFWVYSEQRGWHYDTTDKAYPVASAPLDLNDTTPTDLAFDLQWGAYRLEIHDANGRVLSSRRVFAGHNWYRRWQDNQNANQAARPDKVSLAWNQPHYAARDQAVLSLVPPHAGKALVLVESDHLLWSQWVAVPEEGAQVTIPIDPTWDQHNIYATVIHIQNEQGKSTHRKRSIGMIHLPLDRSDRQLTIALDTPATITPNQTLSVPVHVGGSSHAAVGGKTYLTLAAVDVGVLNITDFTTPDPFQFFFEPRRNAVFGSDMYQRLIESSNGARAQLRSGGDASLSRGGRQAQAEVNIVSLFSGLVETDDQGNANVPLEIPNFNGRLRLMAVAFDDRRFGSADKNLTVAAPITAEIAMPRFLATDDKTTLAMDLHNLTDKPQAVTLDWSADLPLNMVKQSHQVTLQPQEKRVFKAAISASYPTGNLPWQGVIQASLSAHPLSSSTHALSSSAPSQSAADQTEGKPTTEAANAADTYQFHTQWPINLRHPYPAVATHQSQTLKPGDSLSLDPSLLRGLELATTEIQLSYRSTADFQAQSQFDQLLAYPYGCLEQTASATFPWLLANQNGYQQLGLKPITPQQQSDAISHGLARIAERQRLGGGFGLWSSQSPEEHWLTAYVGELFWLAREQGFAVDDTLYQATLHRLERYYRNRSVGRPRWSEDPDHYALAYQAYAGYVLALNGRARLSLLRATIKHKAEDTQTPLPLIHLAVAVKLAGDQPLAQQLVEKALRMAPTQRYLGDYGSDIRDKALAVDLLLRFGLDDTNAHALSFALAESLQQRQYLSTQERNALFRAAISLADASPANVGQTVDVEIQQGALTRSIKKANFSQRFLGDALKYPLIVTHQNGSRANVIQTTIQVSGYSSLPPTQVSDGYEVEKRLFGPQGQPLDLNQLNSGDLVLVQLTVNNTGKRARPDTLIVDLLPAGWEIENANLQHSVKLEAIEVEGQKVGDQQATLTHSESRDDRFVAALSVNTHTPSFVYYLARAVTPGVYHFPPTLVEDMYHPEKRAIGETTVERLTINP